MTGGRDAGGPEGALPELTTAIYAELKAIARARMAGERGDHTLAPTALLHEAWLRLQGRSPALREHARFLAAASREMYRVLVDHARARGRIKRSPPADQRVPLTAAELSEGSAEEILAVEEALRRLEGHDPRLAEVARLKTFAELEDGAVARALGVSERTARRDWALARAWLQRVLSE